MNNIILSTRNIDDLISDVANEVIRKFGEWQLSQGQQQGAIIERPMTLPEAADFLQLSTQTVYKLVRQKDVPCIKVPGQKRLYFLKADLIEYLKTGRKKTGREIAAEADRYLANKKGR